MDSITVDEAYEAAVQLLGQRR